MKNIPSFYTENGKPVYKEKYVSALTNAAFSKKDNIIIDGVKINILNSVRNSEDWNVTVEFEGESNE